MGNDKTKKAVEAIKTYISGLTKEEKERIQRELERDEDEDG